MNPFRQPPVPPRVYYRCCSGGVQPPTPPASHRCEVHGGADSNPILGESALAPPYTTIGCSPDAPTRPTDYPSTACLAADPPTHSRVHRPTHPTRHHPHIQTHTCDCMTPPHHHHHRPPLPRLPTTQPASCSLGLVGAR